MSGSIQAFTMTQTRLRTTITTGNSGSTYGYRTTAGPFGSLAVTSWAGFTITDLYTDAGNELIITFNAAPNVSMLREIRAADSFGGTVIAPTSLASIVGNSFVWATSLTGPVYGASGQVLNVTLTR